MKAFLTCVQICPAWKAHSNDDVQDLGLHCKRTFVGSCLAAVAYESLQQTMYQALSFTSDFKLGHYMKGLQKARVFPRFCLCSSTVPPRTMFVGQVCLRLMLICFSGRRAHIATFIRSSRQLSLERFNWAYRLGCLRTLSEFDICDIGCLSSLLMK